MVLRSILFRAVALSGLALGNTMCRYIPSDPEYPGADDWSALNKTVVGRLIRTMPQASVCHTKPSAVLYNEAACADLQSIWSLAQIYELKPAEIMNGYYQNQSCDPFTDKSKTCELGNYAAYSIKVHGAHDVIAGIKFAKEKNIRLVIKSTGHDYLGRSTGKGALSLWMWNLKTAEVIENYENARYKGPAMKLGPGLIAGEAYEIAAAAGYRIVGGECASVSLAGGYTQGGGHSLLNTAYGMAADNVLEWEVVTAAGEHLLATPTNNTDLYWALSGGGAGIYGVVLSMTTKLYADGPVANAALTFSFTDISTQDSFWEAVSSFFEQMPSLVAANNSVLVSLQNQSFSVIGFTLPDQSVSVADDLIAPFLAGLDRLGLAYTFTSGLSPSYIDYFDGILGPLPYGPFPPTEIWTSRLIPRAVVQNVTANAELIDAFRTTVADGTFLVGCNVFSVAEAIHEDNALPPAWRDAIALCNTNAFWDFEAPLHVNLAVKEDLVSLYTPLIEAATPGSGVYGNELDPWYKNSDWKYAIYGENYDRLLSIKHANDPDHLLYGQFAVGGDKHSIDEDGRLCLI
ncbi:putative FAD-dependent isoamyl alcohol oxidase [Nemania sp. FL0031]|nr:putative FAD-dependent isoamyl alcohol oxidase [Nemania sp. FL0031]